MTGYGRGVAERGGRRATVEIRAVNHRFLDVKLRGAALDGAVEDQLGGRIREALDRGAVTASVHLERHGPGRAPPRPRRRPRRPRPADLAGRRPRLAAARARPDPGPARRDGAVGSDDAEGEAAEAVLAAADDALAALVAMRGAEGQTLAADLDGRLATLGQNLTAIEARAAAEPGEARRRIDERLRRLLGDGDPPRELDPARLAQEVAILADKLDITEELVRARSHVGQLRKLIGGPAARGGIGRRLDFLVQEIGRELNTMGAKSAAPEIVDLVVRSKAELEKVREQVQNVE